MSRLDERYRPQFHYTVVNGWINDPIGLIRYDGIYHLFNDHNPVSTRFPGGTVDGEKSHWAHAVSEDLVHWRHMPIAIQPDANGACWSGSAVVDEDNSAGFAESEDPPLVLVYTSAGSTFGQSLAYSNDKGMTWHEYEGNPVLGQLVEGNRDPMVFRYGPTGQWVMILFVVRGQAHFYLSDDLKSWELCSIADLDGFYECPDMFELAVDGDDANRKWVIHDARFMYWIGTFDGRTFVAETGPIRGEYGRNFYAAQSWHNTGNRLVQIGWMNGGEYPGMPFSQQMGFPCELSLRTVAEGIRLCRSPVAEIESLYRDSVNLAELRLVPGTNALSELAGDAFDIEFVVNRNDELCLECYDMSIRYSRGTVTSCDQVAEVSGSGEQVELRILVDRTSVEVFVNNGEISMSSCFVPETETTGLRLVVDQPTDLRGLRASALNSAWISGEEPTLS